MTSSTSSLKESDDAIVAKLAGQIATVHDTKRFFDDKTKADIDLVLEDLKNSMLAAAKRSAAAVKNA